MMKKTAFSVICLVLGFFLFCLLHMAHLKRNPIYDYTWIYGSILVVLGLVLGFIGLRKESITPIFALVFSFSPILLFSLGWIPIPSIGIIFMDMFFRSLWGLGFCLIGIILGIFSLYRGIKYKRAGTILSIIAILAPFGWVLYLYLYVQSGGRILI